MTVACGQRVIEVILEGRRVAEDFRVFDLTSQGVHAGDLRVRMEEPPRWPFEGGGPVRQSHFRILAVFGVFLSPLFLLVAQGPPEFARKSITNAATLAGRSRPESYFGVGSIITIFGRNLATETVSASQFPLPTELGGTQVLFYVANSGTRVPGRLLYVSPSQINVVTPATARFFSSIYVETRLGTAHDHQVIVSGADPGIFTSDGSGCGRPALWSHRLGRILGLSDSLAPGEVVTLYGTGFGPPYAPEGEPAPATPPLDADPAYRYGAVLGDGSPGGLQRVDVLWQGKAPGWAGGDQFNIRIPETAPEGCAIPFRVTNPAMYYTRRSSQLLSVPISRGGACQDPPRDAFLRLVLVREVNSGMSNMPARRDRLWVDFFGGPPPETSPFDRARSVLSAGYESYGSGIDRFRGRVCPGLEGVSEDAIADALVYDSHHWEAKISQDAGTISVSSAGQTMRLAPGLPNGLPYYSSDLPANFLQDGRVKVSAAGGRHVGAFDAEIALPPFAMVDNLPPGMLLGSQRLGLYRVRWSGGPAKGFVRWWVGQGEVTVYASRGRVQGPDRLTSYGADENNTLDTVYLLVTPDVSEEVTFTANGLRYGGRLTYLYVYRFGGLKLF